MNVVHAKPNSKKKIRSLPFAENYLVEETGGALRWAEPNDSWRIYSPTGQQRYIISNIRYDDSDHSPDLWIYSVLKKNEMGGSENLIANLINGNRVYLDRTRKWYVRQFIETSDRVGIKRFTGLPLNAFRVMWRKTIPTNDIQIYGLSNNQMKILYREMDFNVYLKWWELQKDMLNSPSFIIKKSIKWYESKVVMPWLHQHCRGGIILFSDYDVMLPDFQDEFAYIADVA